MNNTSTFIGNHGDMAEQVMGCTDGYAAYCARFEAADGALKHSVVLKAFNEFMNDPNVKDAKRTPYDNRHVTPHFKPRKQTQ